MTPRSSTPSAGFTQPLIDLYGSVFSPKRPTQEKTASMYQRVVNWSLCAIADGSQARILFNVDEDSEENEMVADDMANIAGKRFRHMMTNKLDAEKTCDGFSDCFPQFDSQEVSGRYDDTRKKKFSQDTDDELE